MSQIVVICDHIWNLSCNIHIDRISKNANSMLGVFTPQPKILQLGHKSQCILQYARSHLEYCSSVWNSHHKDHIQKLKMVQRIAARYTTNHFRNMNSVQPMLEHLHLESLEIPYSTKWLMTWLIYQQPPPTSRPRSSHTKKYRPLFSPATYS